MIEPGTPSLFINLSKLCFHCIDIVAVVKNEVLESDRTEGNPEKRRLSPLQCTKNDHDLSSTALRNIFQNF